MHLLEHVYMSKVAELQRDHIKEIVGWLCENVSVVIRIEEQSIVGETWVINTSFEGRDDHWKKVWSIDFDNESDRTMFSLRWLNCT